MAQLIKDFGRYPSKPVINWCGRLPRWAWQSQTLMNLGKIFTGQHATCTAVSYFRFQRQYERNVTSLSYIKFEFHLDNNYVSF